MSSESVSDTYIGKTAGIKEYQCVVDGSKYYSGNGPDRHTKTTYQWMEYQTYYDTYYTHLGTIDASKVIVHLTDGEIFANKLPTLIKAKTMYINLNKYLLSLEIK